MITIKKNENRQINNTPYYNDALAYDFEMFMPKKSKPNNVIEYKPKKTIKPRAKYRVDIISVFCVIAIFAAIMYSLFLRVSICESNHSIKKIEKSISGLQSEKSRLDFEYQNKISYQNLEQKASELGMRKMTKDQIVYIFTNEEDKAILKDGRIDVSDKN